MTDHRFGTVVLMILGLISQPVRLSTQGLGGGSVATTGAVSQSAEGTTTTHTGSIVGVVVNERKEPVVRAQVQAFSTRATVRQTQPAGTPPFSVRASGSAATDEQGHFRISGLESGEYVIAAQPPSSFPSGGPTPAILYATTFYPSTIDDQQSLPVSVFAPVEPPTSVIQLVRVRGARVSGSVVSSLGRPTSGLNVRLFHRFGGFGSAANVAVVSAKGTFEIPRVPPGWYRLSIEPASPDPKDGRREYVEKLIEVQDDDLDDLALVLGPDASISGRVAAVAGANVPTPVGLRVNASPAPGQFAESRPMSATVTEDWSFRMTGPSGVYRFSVGADRAPFVTVTRVSLNGADAGASTGVELVDGIQEVVVFVAVNETPPPTVDSTRSSDALIEQFKNEKTFWRQFTVAKAIVERHDASVLPTLVGWLSHEDRHLRGNAAFIFAGLGDPRGFQVIVDTLTDRSDRPEGQGIALASSDGRYHVAAQIAADRYYAAHLLGDLRDPRAVPLLAPLIQDKEVHSIVPWALGQIGDAGAIGALFEALEDPDPSIRVLAIYALDPLHVKDALPRLTPLLNDHRRSNFGAQVSVAEAARAAITRLQ